MGNCVSGSFTPPYSPQDVQTWPQGMQPLEVINQVCAVARFILSSKLPGAADQETSVIQRQLATLQALSGRWNTEWAPQGLACLVQSQQLPIVTAMVGLVDQLSRIKSRLERVAVKPAPLLGGNQRTAGKAVKLLQAALDAHDTFKNLFLGATGSNTQALPGTRTSRPSQEQSTLVQPRPAQRGTAGVPASYMHQMYWSDGEGSPGHSLHPDLGTLLLGSVTAASTGGLVPHPDQQYMLVLTPGQKQSQDASTATNQGSSTAAGQQASMVMEPVTGVLLPMSMFSRPGSPHPAGSPHTTSDPITERKIDDEQQEFFHMPDSPNDQSQGVNPYHAVARLQSLTAPAQGDMSHVPASNHSVQRHPGLQSPLPGLHSSTSPFSHSSGNHLPGHQQQQPLQQLQKQQQPQQQQLEKEGGQGVVGKLDAAMEQLGNMLRVRAAEQSGNMAALVATLTAAADAGDAAACLRLGQLYQSGKALVPLSPTTAEAGSSSGQAAMQTRQAMQHAAAAYWYHRGFQGGDVDCAAGLGYLLEFGLGVAADLQAALQVYSWAALRGSAAATNNLARLLAEGRGAPQDLGTAQQLFERAAHAGSADAAFNLATSLALHQGPRWSQSGTPVTEIDTKQQQSAMFWLTQASRAGHTEAALQLLNVLWRSGQHAAALKEVLDAAAAGSAGAALHTAQLLEQIATWIADVDPVHHSSLPADLDPQLLGVLSDVPALLPPVGLQLRCSHTHDLASSLDRETAKPHLAGVTSCYSSSGAVDGAVKVDVRNLPETDKQAASRRMVEAALQAGLTPAEQLHAAAKRWYQQAAQAGEADAQLWVGQAYWEEGRVTAALAMWRRATRGGSATAALMCGYVEEEQGCTMLASGSHLDQVRQHLHEALTYYKRAQELGLADGEEHVQRVELLVDELDTDPTQYLPSRTHSLSHAYALRRSNVAGNHTPWHTSAVDGTWLTQQLSTSMRLGSVRSLDPTRTSFGSRQSMDMLRDSRRGHVSRAHSLQPGPHSYLPSTFISRAQSVGPGRSGGGVPLHIQGSYGFSSKHSLQPQPLVPSRLSQVQRAQSIGPSSPPYQVMLPRWKLPGASSYDAPKSMQPQPDSGHAATSMHSMHERPLSHHTHASFGPLGPRSLMGLSALQRSVSEHPPAVGPSTQDTSAAAFMAATYRRAAGSPPSAGLRTRHV